MRPAVATDLADSAFDFARVVRAVVLARVDLAAVGAIACERDAITRALKPVPPVVALLLAGALLARLAQVETAVLAGALPWEAS